MCESAVVLLLNSGIADSFMASVFRRKSSAIDLLELLLLYDRVCGNRGVQMLHEEDSLKSLSLLDLESHSPHPLQSKRLHNSFPYSLSPPSTRKLKDSGISLFMLNAHLIM